MRLESFECKWLPGITLQGLVLGGRAAYSSKSVDSDLAVD